MKPEAKKAIIFDLDGVLVNSIRAHAYAYEQLFLPFGIAFGFERYATEVKGMSRPDVIRKILGELPTAQFQELMAKKAHLTEAYIKEEGLTPIPGALEFVAKIQNLGLKNAVATASRAPQLLLGAIGALDLFDVVIDASMVEFAKPHPDVFLKAMDCIGAVPEATLIIEDSLSGIEAALASGATVYALSTTEERQALNRAHRVFSGYENLDISDFLAAP